MRTRTNVLAMVLLVGLAGAAGVTAQDGGETDPALATRIERLVDRLADADFKVRDQAAEELVEIGERALPALQEAARSEDPEVAWRAKKTIGLVEARIAEKKSRPEETTPEGRGPDGTPELDELFRSMPGFDEGMRKRMEEAFRQAFQGQEDREGGTFFFRNFAFEGDGTSRREIDTGDKKYVFETTPEGAVKGSVETTENGEKVVKEFSYESKEAFEKADPELYGVYEKNAGTDRGLDLRGGPFRFQFRAEGFEEMQRQLEEMRKRLGRAFGGTPDREPGELPDSVEKAIERAMEEARRRAAGEEPAEHAETPEADESYAGLSGQPVEPALRAQLDVAEGQGLLVSDVEPESRAESWGLKKWDLILSADGEAVGTVPDFQKAVESLGEGGTAVVQIIRHGQREELRITR